MSEQDLSDIEAFMRAAGVRAVADAVRACENEVDVYRGGDVYYQRWQETNQVFESRGMHRVSPVRIVDPVEESLTWWQTVDKGQLTVRMIALGLVIAAVVAAVSLITMLLHALAIAVAAVVPMLSGLLLVLVLVMLLGMLSGGGGGGGFSGTFSGRMH